MRKPYSAADYCDLCKRRIWWWQRWYSDYWTLPPRWHLSCWENEYQKPAILNRVDQMIRRSINKT